MARWLIEKAGVRVTVHPRGKHAKALLAPILAELNAIEIPKARGVKLTVKGETGEWRLHDHSNDLKRKLTHDGDLIYHLSDRIVFHVADQADAVHCLHAAAVGHQHKAIIVPASSGSGKSTFTAWLVANGFAYITDELILVDGHTIQGLARPIQIKAHGIDAITPLLTEPDALIKGKLANAVLAESLGGVVATEQEHELGIIIFPRYQKGAEFSFEKLSSAEAGMKLMSNHVNARNLEGHGFRDMMALIRETPCFSLEYGGFRTLPRDFAEQLTALIK